MTPPTIQRVAHLEGSLERFQFSIHMKPVAGGWWLVVG